MDMYKVMKTLYDTGFDRALGATYIQGLWEAIVKQA